MHKVAANKIMEGATLAQKRIAVASGKVQILCHGVDLALTPPAVANLLVLLRKDIDVQLVALGFDISLL